MEKVDDMLLVSGYNISEERIQGMLINEFDTKDNKNYFKKAQAYQEIIYRGQ